MTTTAEDQKSRDLGTTKSPSRRSSSISAKQSKENVLGRRHSERHQVVKIQNYVIYRKTIGAGSMGKVKLAECLTDIHKQKYAVKIMPKVDLLALSNTTSKSKSKDPKDTPEEREQRTIREMAIMRLLRHPNICQLKEYITEGDKYYMFLELVDGGALLDYIIKHGKLKEKQARKFARQIVSALDYCHRNSIVHRDLKIENILITTTEQIKIIDFGLSNVYSPTEQLNTFCGSLYFAAPELLKAKEYTGPEVDVWSFGVVLYVLVCGRVPFDDTNLPALHEKIKAGIVEDYPDHLGKDCLDLLHKIFVVDPNKRITLSAIQSHPWMNKGFEEPIRNYLPHRQPLESIDMNIVNGMNGFGLGEPEEIKQKLEKIISSPAYQVAALKIDQNYLKKANNDQQLANKPKWRRTLSTRRTNQQIQDDFQSLPAMYDPLVSIYYLVKERKESDERKRQLLEAESTPITLSRSTSTLVVSSNNKLSPNSAAAANGTAADGKSQASLMRRRTFDTSKKLPDLPRFNRSTPPTEKKAAEETNKENAITSDNSNDKSNELLSPMNTPIPTASKSEKTPSRTTLFRKKSLQAVRKFLPSSIHNGLSSHAASSSSSQDKIDNNCSNISSSSSASAALTAAATNNNEEKANNKPTSNGGKSHWLKLERSDSKRSNSTAKQEKRQSTNSTNSSSTTSRPNWRRLSISSSRRNTRLSLDNSTSGNLPTQVDPLLVPNGQTATADEEGRKTPKKISSSSLKQKDNPVIVMESSKSEIISSSSMSLKNNRKKITAADQQQLPKSIFNFNRGQLFRVTPNQMMTDLQQILKSLNIQSNLVESQFLLQCQCPYSVWSKFINSSSSSSQDKRKSASLSTNDSTTTSNNNFAVTTALKFNVMIYEARWAGGKIGFKVREDNAGQENAAICFYIKQVLKNISNCLLTDVEHLYQSAA